MSVSVPLCAAFIELPAVTVTLPVDEGAVNKPADVMLPALADQVYVVPALPEVWAPHCDVVKGAMIVGMQETEMPFVVLGGTELLDPHAVRRKAQADARNSAIV